MMEKFEDRIDMMDEEEEEEEERNQIIMETETVASEENDVEINRERNIVRVRPYNVTVSEVEGMSHLFTSTK